MVDQSHGDDLKINKRTSLSRIIIDTPALLNMVKHCRESDTNAIGLLMGVVEHQVGQTDDSLLVTQTMPRSNNVQMSELMRAMENES
jgi:hypothetical protein